MILLLSVVFLITFSSCSTQRTTITDYVHDTLVVKSVQHDSIFREVVRYDTFIVTKMVEVETIIRQDSAGKELSRETNRTVNNDTYKSCGVTDKDYQEMLRQDSVASSVNRDKQVETVKEQATVSWWAKLWQKVKMCAWMVCGFIIGFVIGIFWSRIKQVLHL